MNEHKQLKIISDNLQQMWTNLTLNSPAKISLLSFSEIIICDNLAEISNILVKKFLACPQDYYFQIEDYLLTAFIGTTR